MNFDELYAPYVTEEAPSYLDQIPWLKKNGVADHIVDQAMIKVYGEMERGKTFEADEHHSATWHQWMYLKQVADEMGKEELQVYARHLEQFHDKLKREIDEEWESMNMWQKLWAVIRGKA